MLTLISNWLFTDEKWWDIVGPGDSRYIKALSQVERKMLNQVPVNLFVNFNGDIRCMHVRACLTHLFVVCLCYRSNATKVKKVVSRNAFTSGVE